MKTWQRAAFDLAVAGAVAIATSAAAAAQSIQATSRVPSSLKGVNDWSCRPTAEHPRPVVLVHGTGMTSVETWEVMASALADDGFCVFTLDYGRRQNLFGGNLLDRPGGGDIATSALELAQFVERIRNETGATQVDIVGHSQGGVVARQYLKFQGGADPFDPAQNKVRKLVTLGATNHGTTFGTTQLVGIAVDMLGAPVEMLADAALGQSFAQQMIGSSFLKRLNDGGDTVPGVEYTIIASRNDLVSTPPENTFLTAGPDAVVHNLWVQDVCPSAVVDHMQLTTEPAVLDVVRHALASGSVSAPARCSS